MMLKSIFLFIFLIDLAEAFTKYGSHFLKIVYGCLLLGGIVVTLTFFYYLYKFCANLCKMLCCTCNKIILYEDSNGELYDVQGHVIVMRTNPLIENNRVGTN